MSGRCTGVMCCSGVKQVDIAATLEHLRDQRHLMVHTKVTRQSYGRHSVHSCDKRLQRL